MSVPYLEELTKDISPTVLNQECTNKYLAKVSRKLKNWKLLSPYLDITNAEVHSISSESSHDYDEQKLSLLLKWKEKMGKSATYHALIKAIWDSGNVDLTDFACNLAKDTDQKVNSACSMEVTVPAAVLEYKNKLKSAYKANNPIMVGDWPPPPLQEYVRIVLVPKEPQQVGAIDIFLSECGNVDSLLSDVVELDELLKPGINERKVVLFEGSSGSGKSTLFWHICQKWQCGELLQQFALVLLVQLRDKAVQEAQDLTGILPYLPSRKVAQLKDHYVNGIEEVEGEGVLILLDGWDEAPVALRRKDSFLYSLITNPSKCSIEKSVIAVSSRPLACRNLRKHSTTRVELRGFTKESRNKYINSALEPNEAEMLIHEIDGAGGKGVIDVNHPLTIVNLVHIFKVSGYTLPSTPCRITITLLLCYLLRHIKKKHDDTIIALNSLDDLPHPVKNSFTNLCKIAYDGIDSENLSFTHEELKGVAEIPNSDSSEITTLGLLQSVHSLVATGFSIRYHFLHLSFQELCAAYHVARLPDPEKTHAKSLEKFMIPVFQPNNPQKVYIDSFAPICNYYSAITGLHNLTIAKQVQSACIMYDIFMSRLLARAIIDAGEYIDISSIYKSDSASEMSCNESDIVSDSEYDSDAASEMSCSGSENESELVSNASPNVLIDSRKRYRWQSYSFIEFLIESENPTIVNDVVGKEIKMYVSQSSEMALSTVVLMTSGLEKVECYNQFTKTIEQAICCHKETLKELNVHISRSINDLSDFQSVLNVLQTCHNLKTVNIQVHFAVGIADEAAHKLAISLKRSSLEKLTINAHGSIQDDGIAALAPALCAISYVTLYCQQMGPCSFTTFAEVLPCNNSIKYLEINVQQYQGDDRAFFNNLKKSTSLTGVVISGTDKEHAFLSNTSVGRALLSGDLKELAAILDLTKPPLVEKTMYIQIDSEAFFHVDFKSGIFVTIGPRIDKNHFYPGRPVLKPKESLGIVAMKTLSITLREVCLRELFLRGHDIGDEGAKYIADALTKTTSLELLILRNCSIGEKGIASLFASLTENTSLSTLDVSFNPLGDNGAVTIASFINNTSLEGLDISGCDIEEKGIAAIASALQTNTILKKLGLYVKFVNDHYTNFIDVSNPPKYNVKVISQRSELALAKMLLRNSTLKFLLVSQNAHMPTLFTFHDHHECPMLLRNSTLKFLLVSLNAHMPTLFTFHDHHECPMFKISEQSTTSLLSTSASEFYYRIKLSSMIGTVEIPSTSELGHALWSGNMTEAASMLELNHSPTGVERIDFQMSGNIWQVDYSKQTIEEADEGLRKIRSIHSNPETWAKLTELNLTRTPLGSVGACLLAEILNQTHIQDLNVAGCGIGEEGVVALANALSTNTTIKCLSIGGNEISKCGQDAIIEALSKNTVLSTLNIQKIYYGREIAFSDNGDEDFSERFSKLPRPRKLIT